MHVGIRRKAKEKGILADEAGGKSLQQDDIWKGNVRDKFFSCTISSYHLFGISSNRNPAVDSNLSMDNQFNSFKHQASMGFNMLFSVLATFGMTYYIAGQMGNNSSQVSFMG